MATRSKTTGMTRSSKTAPCAYCGKPCKAEYGTDLCSACYEDAGFENEHQDGYHTEFTPACPLCNPSVRSGRIVEPTGPIQGQTERPGCGCGCGEFPKGKKSRFLPGHDAKAASAAKASKPLARTGKVARCGKCRQAVHFRDFERGLGDCCAAGPDGRCQPVATCDCGQSHPGLVS